MSQQIIDLKCPGCGNPVSSRDKVCIYCGNPVMITSFHSVADMSMPLLNKYLSPYCGGLFRSYYNDDDINGYNDECVELSQYIGVDFNKAGTEMSLTLTDYEEGEYSYTYTNDCIQLGSYDGQSVDSISIYEGDSYSIFGLYPWLSRFEVEETLPQYGYSLSEEYDGFDIYVNHENNSALYIFYQSNTLQSITSIEYMNQY